MRFFVSTLCLLPACAIAKWTLLQFCDNGWHDVDPYMFTEPGKNMRFNGKLIGMHSPWDIDRKLTCQKFVSQKTSDGLRTVKFEGKDENDVPFLYMGNATSMNYNSYLNIRPWKEEGVLQFPKGIMNARDDGTMRMYFTYVSAREFVIKTCSDTTFGSYKALYVFSENEEVLSSDLDSKCMAESVARLPGSDGLDIEMKSQEDFYKCT